MTTLARPRRAAFKTSAVILAAAFFVTTAGTPVAGGQSSGSLGADSLSPGGGSGGSLGSAGGSLGSSDPVDIELVGPDAPPLWPGGRPVEHRIIPNDDTVIADPGTVMSVTGAIGEGQSTVITPDQDDLPGVGQHFVVDVAPGSPSGVVGRVTGVSTLPSGLVQVTTEPAGIEDAYEEFSINTTVSLEDAVSTEGGSEEGQAAGRMQARSGAGLSARPSLSWLECEGSRPQTFDAGFNWGDLTAQVVFTPTDKYLKIVVNHTLSADFTMAFGGSVKCHVPANRMPSAFIPVAGPLGLKTSPVVDLGAAAAATVTAESRARRSDGVELSDSRARAISRAEPLHNEVSAQAGVNASLYLGVKGELAANIRAVEATAGISAGPELSASWTARDCVELSATLKVTAAVSASAFWLFEWSHSIMLARIGFLSLIIECGAGGSTTTRTTTTTPTTTTSTPSPGFRDGALTNLVVGAGLACDIQSPTDARSVYYGPGACATLAYVDGRSYGPTVPASGAFSQGWTPVAQTVTGTATASDPMVIRTTVRAGDTGIELEQVDYFINGNPGYQTDITVRNRSEVSKDVKIYRAVDCYLSLSDFGTGSIYSRSVSCNDTSGRRIALTDLSGGAHRQEAYYSNIWAAAQAGIDYDDTAVSSDHDNGMGINWDQTVSAGGSVVLRSRFQLDEPVQSANAGTAGRMAPLGTGPDVKREQPAEERQPLPTSVPTA